MKYAILGATLSASLCLAATVDARGRNSIDFGNATCGEFVETVAASSENDVAAMMLWLDGYLSGVSGDAVLRFDALGEFGERLVDRCGKRPREKLLVAAERVGLE